LLTRRLALQHKSAP